MQEKGNLLYEKLSILQSLGECVTEDAKIFKQKLKVMKESHWYGRRNRGSRLRPLGQYQPRDGPSSRNEDCLKFISSNRHSSEPADIRRKRRGFSA